MAQNKRSKEFDAIIRRMNKQTRVISELVGAIENYYRGNQEILLELRASKSIEQVPPKILASSGDVGSIDSSIVEKCIEQGKKLAAIRYVQEVAGFDLRQAYNWVNSYITTKGKVL